jgi:hypothetical protein
MMERVSRHIERLQAQFTFARVTENMALRDIIERGLKAIEAEAEAKPAGEQLILPVEEATTRVVGPQAPPGASAMEQAAAAVSIPPVEPREPSEAEWMTKQCGKGHPPYRSEKKNGRWRECPECVNERNRNKRAREKEGRD